jgi:flagellar biosynthesis protein FliR
VKYRSLFLGAAAIALFYAYFLIRMDWFLNVSPTYGSTDVTSGTALAIACIAAWVVLEVVATRAKSRGVVCQCGYSLRGVRCPECGEPIGADRRPAAGGMSKEDRARG